MRIFKNMKIGMRLGLAFSAVLLLSLFVGIFSISRLAIIQNNVEEVTTNWMTASRALSDFDSVAAVYRRNETRLLLAITPEDELAAEKDLEDLRQKSQLSWQRYAATITPGPEEKLAKTVYAARTAYFATTAKLIDLARAGPEKNLEGRRYITGESKDAMYALKAAIDADLEFQDKGAHKAYKDAINTYKNARLMIIVSMIAVLFAGVVLAFLITRSVTAPMKLAVNATQRVSEGDLTEDIDVKSGDETGQLLSAMQRMNANLTGMIVKIRGSAEFIATGSTQIAAGNADLSRRTEEQASSLEETAASMEQLTASVRQNSEAAQQANQLATSASAAAENGGEIVVRVVSVMEKISASSNRISDIIGVIDGIAFQTNILALNAAVEAARAGDQGRGFAVVASEVRNLAKRSADAAKEIAGLISDSVETVKVGNTLVNNAGESMQDIVSQVRRVTELVNAISIASAEQFEGVSQIGHAVTQLDQVTQQNSALVEQSAAAAESLKNEAANLTQVVAAFKTRHGAEQPGALLEFAPPGLLPV
jgi:methyl-accepting chemotaxis protein